MTPTPEGLVTRLREAAAEIATDIYVFPDAVAELMTEAAAALAAMQQPAPSGLVGKLRQLADDMCNHPTDPMLTCWAERVHEIASLVAMQQPVVELCGCGRPVRYEAGFGGGMACNKQIRCKPDPAAQLAAKDREIAELRSLVGQLGRDYEESADTVRVWIAESNANAERADAMLAVLTRIHAHGYQNWSDYDMVRNAIALAGGAAEVKS